MRKGSANKDHTNIWIDDGKLILNKRFLGEKVNEVLITVLTSYKYSFNF